MPGHVHSAPQGRKYWVSLIATALFVVGEWLAGLQSHSLALISDAGHNASDALSLGLAGFALWASKTPASKQKTYGSERVGILVALLNAVTLLILALWIFYEAIHQLLHPRPVAGHYMVWVALISVLLNSGIAWWLSSDARGSLNARAAYIHMAGDALASLAVVVAGLIVYFTGWQAADPVASLFIGLFIAYSAWDVVNDSVSILLQATPKDLKVDVVAAGIKGLSPVQDVHDLHVWTLSDDKLILTCHVEVPETLTISEASQLVSRLTDKMQDEHGIGHCTIQVERFGSHPPESSQSLLCKLEAHPGVHDRGSDYAL